MGVLYDVIVSPLLAKFGFAPKDPTFGRYLLRQSDLEIEFEAKPHIVTQRRRVFFKNANIPSTKLSGYSKTHIEAPAVGNATQQEYIEVLEGEDVNFTQSELDRGRGRQWIVYKIYENDSPEARNGKARGCDIVFSHGEPINVLPLV